jgi:hypothetical protein
MSASRRYRGLHLVSNDGLLKVSRHLSRLTQTKAIVEQVEREIAHRAANTRPSVAQPTDAEMMLLSPVNTGPSLPARAARRLAVSLFPAGL